MAGAACSIIGFVMLCGLMLMVGWAFKLESPGEMRCGECGRVVTPELEDPFSIVLWMLLFLAGIIPGVAYMWFVAWRRRRRCPECEVEEKLDWAGIARGSDAVFER
jgi:hypothetical protein